MSEIATWDVLTKLKVDSSHYIPITGHKRFQLQSLFPALALIGVGESPYAGITNKNQLNFKSLVSSTPTMVTVVTNGTGQLEFAVLPAGIDLSLCDNTTSLFLASVDLTADVGATVLPVANGGTNLSTIAAGAFLYGSGAGVIAGTSPLTTNGALFIGSAAGPVAAVPASADNSVTITASAGGLDFASSFPNITGLIIDAQITSLAATKITGSILDAQITSIAGSKVTGTRTQPVETLAALTLLDSKYTQSGTNLVVTEEILASYTLPGGTVFNAGEGIEVKAFGSCAATANLREVSLSFGGTKIMINGSTPTPNGMDFEYNLTVINDGAGGTLCKGTVLFGGQPVEIESSKQLVDFTLDQALVFAGHNSVAALNDVLFEGWTVKILR